MSEPVAIVTALIVERPHCFSCLSEKAGLATGELQEVIDRIEGTFVVHSARDLPPMRNSDRRDLPRTPVVMTLAAASARWMSARR